VLAAEHCSEVQGYLFRRSTAREIFLSSLRPLESNSHDGGRKVRLHAMSASSLFHLDPHWLKRRNTTKRHPNTCLASASEADGDGGSRRFSDLLEVRSKPAVSTQQTAKHRVERLSLPERVPLSIFDTNSCSFWAIARRLHEFGSRVHPSPWRAARSPEPCD